MGRRWGGGLQLRLEGIDLLPEKGILLLCLLDADLEVGEVLGLACAVVPLLEERAGGRYGHVLAAAAGHVVQRWYE